MAASGTETGQGLRMITPPLLYAVLMLAIPLLTILTFSFIRDGYQIVIWEFALGSYRAVWADQLFRALLLRALGVAVLVTLATVVLAFPVAYFLSFVVAPRRKAMWIFLFTIPFW